MLPVLQIPLTLLREVKLICNGDKFCNTCLHFSHIYPALSSLAKYFLNVLYCLVSGMLIFVKEVIVRYCSVVCLVHFLSTGSNIG